MDLIKIAQRFALRDFRSAEENGTLNTLLPAPASTGGFNFGPGRLPPNMNNILKAVIPGFNVMKNGSGLNSGDSKYHLRQVFKKAYFEYIDLLFRIKRNEETARIKEELKVRAMAIALEEIRDPISIVSIRQRLSERNTNPLMRPIITNPQIQELVSTLDPDLADYLKHAYMNALENLLHQRNNLNRRSGGKRKTRKR